MSFVLDDRTGRMEVTMFEEVYQRHRDIVVKDMLVQVEGALRFDEFSDAWRIAAKQLQKLTAVRERMARCLIIGCSSSQLSQAALTGLEGALRGALGGPCTVMLRYRGADAVGTMALAEAWRVRPTAELLERIEHLFGAGSVRLQYSLDRQSGPAAVANAVQ